MLLCVEGLRAGEAREELLDDLDAISPLIDDTAPSRVFLDMHGIPGSATAWMARTRAIAMRLGYAPRLGIGPNKITAQATAYVADGSICEPGCERALLAPLPLTLLDIDPAIVDRLHLLGIECFRDLARLPHGPFVRRFGQVSASWHELARGIDRRPFVPRGHTVAIEASIFGEGRAADEAQVFFALRTLLSRIGEDLTRCGKRAGALRLTVELEDTEACTFESPLALPTAHERTMFDLMRAKLEGATFASAIVGLRLQALHLEEGGEAQALFSSGDFDSQRVAVTIARLEAILGEAIARATTRNAHLLEERFTYEPFSVRRHPDPRHPDSCHPEPVEGLVPQLRLLHVREVPVQVRNGEPAMVDRQAVVRSTGPWRIAEREFLPSPVTRDEYDVVLEDGTFARIYRQGTHWYFRGIYE